MDRQTVERRREYVQNIRNSFYEENGMQKRETREVDDSAPEMGLAAALKLRIFLSVPPTKDSRLKKYVTNAILHLAPRGTMERAIG